MPVDYLLSNRIWFAITNSSFFFLNLKVIFIRGLKTIFSLVKWLMLTLVCTLTFWLVARILINFVVNMPFPTDSKTVSMIFLNLFLKTYIVHYFIGGHKTIFCLAKGLVLTHFICTSVLWLVTRILINFVVNIPFPTDSKTVSMICFKIIFVDLNRTLLYSTPQNHLLFGYM